MAILVNRGIQPAHTEALRDHSLSGYLSLSSLAVAFKESAALVALYPDTPAQ